MLESQKSVTLKLSEPAIDSANPWSDDLLARQNIATRLTNLVAAQEPPLSISLHGQWGTGKTFLLRRWQKTLELDSYQAIYFNAWEEDFCDDPLLAMIGHLAEHFEDNKFKQLARKVAEIALPLIKENLLGILKATTGVTIKLDQQKRELRRTSSRANSPSFPKKWPVRAVILWCSSSTSWTVAVQHSQSNCSRESSTFSTSHILCSSLASTETNSPSHCLQSMATSIPTFTFAGSSTSSSISRRLILRNLRFI